jgi:hypothetical protein
MLLQASIAAMRVKTESATSSFSLCHLIEESAAKVGLSWDAVASAYERLYPGELHPTLLPKKQGPPSGNRSKRKTA